MSGSAARFTSDGLSAFQTPLVRPDCAGTAGLSRTLEDW
jgi:hypothetical protein